MLITVEDAQNRAEIKLKRAVEEVKKLLVPAVSSGVQILDLGPRSFPVNFLISITFMLMKNRLLFVQNFI